MQTVELHGTGNFLLTVLHLLGKDFHSIYKLPAVFFFTLLIVFRPQFSSSSSSPPQIDLLNICTTNTKHQVTVSQCTEVVGELFNISL